MVLATPADHHSPPDHTAQFTVAEAERESQYGIERSFGNSAKTVNKIINSVFNSPILEMLMRTLNNPNCPAKPKKLIVSTLFLLKSRSKVVHKYCTNITELAQAL